MVIRMDFLGCGQSDRLDKWPIDLWYFWSEQAAALLTNLGLAQVDVTGCSGGTLAALSLSLEHPNTVAADSFEGLEANTFITEQIRMGRNYAKQMEEFYQMMEMMHGSD
ncbi:MAG: alpha/beta hydrolase [Firmicutes bacterium]|nr:alpha/beta hydrolase [Bacillota bacterium]